MTEATTSTTNSWGGLSSSSFFSSDKPKPLLKAMKQASRQALSTANRSLSTAHNSLQKGWEQAQRTMTSSIKADATESDPRQAGAAVQTPYGTGMVQEFRANTSTFVVRLESGGLLYTQEVPKIVPSDDDQTTASLSSSLFTPFATINRRRQKEGDKEIGDKKVATVTTRKRPKPRPSWN